MAVVEQGVRAARRDGWVALGLFVSATAAAVSSFDGLRSLALATGWGEWLSPLLPLCIDAYAATATRVWLASSTRSVRARRFARWNAVGAVVLSVLGNSVWHAIAAGILQVTWVIVVIVGAVPAAVLGLLSHLAVLRTQDDGDVQQVVRGDVHEPGGSVPQALRTESEPSETVQRTGSSSSNPPRYASEDELLASARTANAEYRTRYGKPITRDQLRRELRIGGQRATEVLRRLKEERATASGAELPFIPQQTSP